ncbi:class I SAM-dependent methyltransferase [Algoriphagus algorifonticola]|uniref:SAM-dependent methyltransferase n=1 Tax=Algoriphagus algorifonticola TaxID=2593007 RepID=UPI001C92EA2F|nr:SAM-dependent methyltransferase [Algoriphagus algorifonticola]
MMIKLDEDFWTERYRQGYTGWDIGYPSTPIVQYLDQIQNKNCRILIPGAGNAYEAAYAWNQGFVGTHILDISKDPLTKFSTNHPNFPQAQIFHQDFFQHEGKYDLIVEQTFFCALDPALREAYCQKMLELLQPSGRLIGLLFGVQFSKQGPPFGGSLEEYQLLFSKYFKIHKLELCINSIAPRRGNEIFINLSPQ